MKKIIIVTILSMVSMGIFAKDTKEQKFWKWFVKNEPSIFEFEKNQEAVFDSISEKLNAYREDLVFEFSAIENGKREFVISADGLRELFPAVELLAGAAPALERWNVTAYRPRMKDYESIDLNYAGKQFSPSNIWVYSRVEDGSFDVIIYHPEYEEEDRNLFVSGSYILLDTALGEYDVVTGLRYIDHQRLPENPEGNGLIPFSELRAVFDEYKSKKANQ
ncbi:hypothetical protein [Alkalimarinus sediminis]|jgi:hypothetical protein|uniref:START domain-containing protein n=2 Tax=Alkalimarinus sediminis TaxID=1632866 RepID=A0A9E8HKU0_9ALTE|nr:hypothetical protein [Alkalimarinus sediminis]UZW74538.1 hypothetical protein NNL22_16165 [Alkalimarinus sediminis]UZW76356.1 hypothetical protein NNL22_07155 [Alkalimarinus sediminis]